MKALVSLHDGLFGMIERGLGGWFLPTLARFTFASALLFYFWNSALTKVGEGIAGFFQLSLGAYAQIFPRAMEAAGYDVSQLGGFHRFVVAAGTYSEFLLPLLIVVGLATRLAALGMIGFIVIQSLTDLFGHGGIADPATLGAMFDRMPDSVILDQRLFWIVPLLILVTMGAGPLSVDRALRPQASSG